MPVKRRLPKHRAELSPAQVAFLYDRQMPETSLNLAPAELAKNYWDAMRYEWLTASWRDRGPDREATPDGSPTARDLWATYGDDVLATWVVEYPGTRPSGWWRFAAPEPLGEGEDELQYLRRHTLLLPEERRRLEKPMRRSGTVVGKKILE